MQFKIHFDIIMIMHSKDILYIITCIMCIMCIRTPNLKDLLSKMNVK